MPPDPAKPPSRIPPVIMQPCPFPGLVLAPHPGSSTTLWTHHQTAACRAYVVLLDRTGTENSDPLCGWEKLVRTLIPRLSSRAIQRGNPNQAATRLLNTPFSPF